MDKREGEVSRLSLEFFCLTVSNNAVGEPFSLSLISGIEKVPIRELGEREFQDFPSKFLLSQSAENFRWVTLLCCLSETF